VRPTLRHEPARAGVNKSHQQRGFLQFFVAWSIQATGMPIAPAYYLMFGAAIGLPATLFLTARTGDAELLGADVVERTAT
jgi:hypothetical protein